MKIDKTQWEKDREKLDNLRSFYKSLHGDNLPQEIGDDLADIERGLEKVRPSETSSWVKALVEGTIVVSVIWGGYKVYECVKKRR